MSREKVLADVRRALGVREDGSRAGTPPEGELPERRVSEPVDAFQVELEKIGGFVLESGTRWEQTVQGFLSEHALKGVFAGPGVGGGFDPVDEAAARRDPEKVLGLVRAEWGVAASGSVVLDQAGSILPSVLVDTVLVLLDPERIIENMADLPEPRGRRLIVTGPARTADIEKKIVLGAHGAKRWGVVFAPL